MTGVHRNTLFLLILFYQSWVINLRPFAQNFRSHKKSFLSCHAMLAAHLIYSCGTQYPKLIASSSVIICAICDKIKTGWISPARLVCRSVIVVYSAAISSASPSWRRSSSARSASAYAWETSSCTLAAACSSSGASFTLR